MAGSISLSLSQQFDALGNVLAGGKLYFYQAGTVATPQNAFQDSALTLPYPNPLTLDAAGRVPQLLFADGQIKIRLDDRRGQNQLTVDNILVIGPSSGGGGGGGGVDPTTVLQTGDIKIVYGVGALTGFVRVNGRTIGSASSGASERANSDTSALFSYLWNVDPNNLAVAPGGRGVSAAADFAANKTIALPDFRGRTFAGLDDMGNSPAGVLTTSPNGFGSGAGNPTLLGQGAGLESVVITTANLPAYAPAGSVATATSGTIPTQGFAQTGSQTSGSVSLGSNNGGLFQTPVTGLSSSSAFTGSAQGGTSTPSVNLAPTRVVTFYIKL